MRRAVLFGITYLNRRKVRTPAGRMTPNRSSPQGLESATEIIPPLAQDKGGKDEMAR